MPLKLPIAITLLTMWSCLPAAGRDASPYGRPAVFLERHCVECHGAKEAEGDVRLDVLGTPTVEGDEGQTWLGVLDVLEAGDMPPKKVKARPGKAEVEAVVREISEALGFGEQEPEIGLRRLNRTEYEYTVRDLLGVDVPLRELLPEDGEVQGFDNVADGLSLSSVLMERYLEAADVAFDSVIRRFAPLPAETRRAEMMEVKENIASVKEKKGGTIEVEGDFVKFTPGWPPVRMDAVHPIEDGYYRCRIGVWPHEPNGRTLSLAVYVGPLFGPGKRRFMGMYDVTGSAEEPRVIEFETWMAEGEAMHLVPWVYPEHITYRDKDKEARPGIAVAWSETHGPLDQSFPSEAQVALFGDDESISMEPGTPLWMRHRKRVKLHDVVSTQPAADAERIVRELVPRAFRRPVGEDEVAPFVALTLGRLEAGRTFEQAVRSGVKAVLCSPGFLLLNDELEVDGYTLASRLSYFLWSSMPDAELLELAAAGKLGDAGVRRAQVVRMLGDAKAERFVESFVGQWLGVREIEDTTPDKNLYPEFDPLLQESMVRETRGFFRHVLENDLSVVNFLDSDFAFLNQRLADHYDPKDSTSIDRPVPDYRAQITGDIKGKKIGIPKEYRVDGMPAEIEKLWQQGMDWLRDAGAEIVDISLPLTDKALPTYYIIAPAEASSNLARYDGVRYGLRVDGVDLDDMYAKTRGQGFGEEVKRRIMIGTYVLSAGYYDAYYNKARRVRKMILNEFLAAYNQVDAILTPTTPSAAFTLDEAPTDPVTMYLNDVFTVPASLAGLPGLSLPAGLSSEGLPLGLQVLGKPFEEGEVLNVASVLEAAAGFQRL